MIVDIIIVAIVVLAIILGRNKGLTVCLVNFFSLIIALVVAFMFYKTVGNFIIEKTELEDNLKQIIKENIPMSEEGIAQIGDDSFLPQGIKDYVNKQAQNANDTKDEAVETISTDLSTEIIMLISFLGTFIAVRVALLILKIISKIITKLPILKQADHLGGAIIGAVEGIIIVYSIFAVISMISPLFENTIILEQINDSYVGKIMYNNNIIINRLKK